MNEASKTLKAWTEKEKQFLLGDGIDIGCGSDPITPNVKTFDMVDGDANHITKFVNQTFDFVFSSHCLEHMINPYYALLEWWKLVKPGGVIIFIVPDEDLYEQGIFPSRFNSDHKHTFTISKAQSWSPVSVNVLDLAQSLPNGKIEHLCLQDKNYDRRKMTCGMKKRSLFSKLFFRTYQATKIRISCLDLIMKEYYPIAQTLQENAFAQIECIVKKTK
ncbi:MAG: class I SAM-dependent methyltransferase [Bacteroidales bacterium]|nr:class I SAM-dependent methyltransferase [Bacteroidales bacterium]